jgi:class 3 adenylate cyclase
VTPDFQQPTRSFTARLFARVGNPLNWSAVDRAILAACMILPFTVWHDAFYHYFLNHPEAAPYINQAFLRRVLPLQEMMWTGGWVAIILIGLVLRRWAPESSFLVSAVTQLFAIGASLISYSIGHYTANYMHCTALAATGVGMILFERRQMLGALVTFLIILVATTVAEQLQLIPYAPLLATQPVEAHHLATSWLATMGALTTGILLFVFGLLVFVVGRWHSREDQLAQTGEQLARANDLISRYVAQQVAEQIQLGNYDAIDRQSRRRLTLFFSDIKGFTEVADHIEAEELSEILNEYFTEMTTIAGQFGGTIDKFMGDAIMIFFGAPVATHDEDHALRAVRMAMAMQGRMKELHRRWEKRGITEPFQVRMGINTGVASVGNFGAPGRMDYTAIGRQVNLAARLQVNCEPGKVLLSHATWVFVRGEIPCEPKGEIQVKGIRDPVNVYEVTAPYPIEEPSPEVSSSAGAAA